MPSRLSDEAYDTLRDAVRLAKDEQIRKVKTLRARLLEDGHTPAHVDEALKHWANYAQG